MRAVFDKNELYKALETFHVLSRANVTVFNSDFEAICAYGGFPEYCEKLRLDPALEKKCLQSDRRFAKRCAAERKSITYACHAGIVETILPIIRGDMLLGYIIFGGLKDAENKYSSETTVKKACEKYSLKSEEYLGYYQNLLSVNRKQLDAYSRVLELQIENILNSRFVKLSGTPRDNKIIDYLERNYAENFSAGELCDKFEISEKTLYRIVRERTRSTLNEYVTKLRLKKAEELLLDTDMSIAQVAGEAGYDDYNYFIRIFKKNYGVTPLKFRKEQ